MENDKLLKSTKPMFVRITLLLAYALITTYFKITDVNNPCQAIGFFCLKAT